MSIYPPKKFNITTLLATDEINVLFMALEIYFNIMNSLLSSLHTKCSTLAIFIDLKNASDTKIHHILI